MKNNRIAAYIFYDSDVPSIVEQYKSSMIKFAKEKLNTDEIDFYIDITPRDKRVQMNCLMEKIKQKKYGILLLYHCNQLYKFKRKQGIEKILEMDNLLNIRDQILDNGVKIYSVKENKSIG